MKLTDKISEHFTYAEATKSKVAEGLKMDNNVPSELLPKIKLVAENILEPLRIYYKLPMTITSWWRCSALNAMISNNPKSQHTLAEAVDFTIPGIPNMTIAEYICDNLEFDQLILERTWIHCSYVGDKPNRKDILRCPDGRTYNKGLK